MLGKFARCLDLFDGSDADAVAGRARALARRARRRGSHPDLLAADRNRLGEEGVGRISAA